MIRVGVSGCGAVARLYYSPALGLLGNEARLVAVFDPDFAAAEQLAAPAGAKVAGSFEELLASDLDLLVILAPPRLHCEQVCDGLQAGLAVLCEKPMALTMAEADRMIAASRAAARPLAINMVRRLLPQARLTRALIASGALGDVDRIDVFEGGPFDWPVASSAWFAASEGGGILEDLGVHVLDLLVWWFGEPDELAYADDAMGGVAANCGIQLRFGDARASVRLSRDWYRPNSYHVSGAGGWLRWRIHERDELEARLGGEPIEMRPSADSGYVDAIARHIRALAAGEDFVDAADCIGTMRLIERCREARTTMPMDWL